MELFSSCSHNFLWLRWGLDLMEPCAVCAKRHDIFFIFSPHSQYCFIQGSFIEDYRISLFLHATLLLDKRWVFVGILEILFIWESHTLRITASPPFSQKTSLLIGLIGITYYATIKNFKCNIIRKITESTSLLNYNFFMLQYIDWASIPLWNSSHYYSKKKF